MAAGAAMSSIVKGTENATELRLDYEDISAGQFVIVIQGLPDTAGDSVTSSAGGPGRTSASRSTGDARRGTPSSPLIEEARAIYDANAYGPVLGNLLVLAAWRGQEARASQLIAATIENATAENERRATALAEYARAVLCNGLGRYQDALAAAERACVREDLGPFAWGLLELVEAGARSYAREVASEALGRLEEWACATGTDWARGVRARSAALLSDGDEAEGLYNQAIELLGRSQIPTHLARAQLVYGEWLRRENRRVDARAQLRAAHEAFSRIAAEAFAERALRELLATGETARNRTDEARAYLTPQEAQIARLAQDGLSNPEIGAQLFISPRTVQYHLRKVFQKVNITSRNQLGRIALPEGTRASEPRLATRAGASADASAAPPRDPRTVTNAPTPIREDRSW
jgi:DNA-binding CsgD family transcriptional regulator